MPRHLKSTRKDGVIDFMAKLWGALVILAYRVDMRLTPVLTYFQTTPYGTIITDFLATATVAFLLLYGPVALVITVIFWF